MNRRFFIKSGGIALASIGVSLSAPSFLERAVMAQARDRVTGGRRKTLIAIFQRGAVDGLNMVVPYGEHTYYDVRPTIAIPKPQAGNAKRPSISTASLVCIRRWRRSSRCGIRSGSRSFMPPARPTTRVRTLTRRITWNRRRPA